MAIRSIPNASLGTRGRLIQTGYAAGSAVQSCLRRGVREGLDAMWGVAVDLLHAGFCSADITRLTGIPPGLVSQMAKGEGLERVRPGRMIGSSGHWIKDRHSHAWGSIYLFCIRRVLRVQEDRKINGLVIRDALRIADSKAGRWEAFRPEQRSRQVINLTDQMESGDVDLHQCRKCGFHHLVFKVPVEVTRRLVSRGLDCPICSDVEEVTEAKAPLAASCAGRSPESAFEELFD